MNYKYLVLAQFLEFSEKFPDYSVCEMLFTILKSTNKSQELSWIFEMDDRELLTAIENATIKEENED